MPVFASQGTEVTVFLFSMFDIRSNDFVESKRWATEPAITKLGAKRLGEGAKVDASKVDGDGLTPLGFDPRPQRSGFQTSVS